MIKMSPDTSGAPPSVVKRKKKINSNKMYIRNGSDCNCLETSQACNVNIPSIPYCSVGNNINAQHLMSLPAHTSNCKNYLFSSNLLKNEHPPDFAECPEYSSLPTVNMQSNDILTARRFSDPCLPNDSDSSSSTIDERIVQKLKSQVNFLKEDNRKLSKEIEELRLEVNLLKQQNNFKYYNREYEPGLLADIIREVRDAAKVREDAFFARIKHLMEEQQQQLGLNHMLFLSEKQKTNDRMNKLEEQWKNLNVISNRTENTGISLTSINGNNTNSTRQVLELEREALDLRRELQDTRAKKEASDQRLLLLDKKLLSLMRDETQSSDASDDGKTESESLISSANTTASLVSQNHSKITLTGPVTDL